MKQTLLIMSAFLMACVSPANDKQRVYKTGLEYVEIRKQFDTVSLRLTDSQIDGFISKWNSSDKKGHYKYWPDYFITIHFNGDSELSYRISADFIKQKSDLAYSVGDKEYFKKIWYKQAGLPENFFEYFPVFFIGGKFSQDTNPLTAKHLEAIKQVLTFYKHKWIDLRGQLFYEGEIEYELLWNYTTKATDSSWLVSHK